MNQHVPVMLNEVLSQAAQAAEDFMQVEKRGLELSFDGTFGRGGHTSALLNEHREMTMLAFDHDQTAIDFGQAIVKTYEGRLALRRANFEEMALAKEYLDSEAKRAGFDFMLFDLGVSSPQLDVASRGFSFYHDGPLDMRMDDRLKLTAERILNEWGEQDLARVFIELGEIERPFKVVNAIVKDRVTNPFTSTQQLAGLIERVDGWAKKGHHPATRYFMALRLEVNRELQVVEKALPEAMRLLAPGGRLAVITFHSLEDRIVKNLFRQAEDGDVLGAEFGENVKRKAFKPTEKEIAANPRSRSAKLRVFRRYRKDEKKVPKNKYAHLATSRPNIRHDDLDEGEES